MAGLVGGDHDTAQRGGPPFLVEEAKLPKEGDKAPDVWVTAMMLCSGDP